MSLLAKARDLRRRKARDRQHLFVAEGVRTVEEALGSAIEVQGILATAELSANPRGAAVLATAEGRGIPVQLVTPEEFGSAADTDSPQGVLAVARVPSGSLTDLRPGAELRLIVLDALQDPGNVGTILRTAAALGAAAAFALPGTVDLWNAKVVRSGMGAHFHHPCLSGTWDELDAFRRDHAVDIWAADAAGESIEQLEPPARLALVVGNEGGGLSSTSRTRADRLVALPIGATVESLNVAVAAGILLYELRR